MAEPRKLNVVSIEQNMSVRGSVLRSDRKIVRKAGTLLTVLFGITAAINLGAFVNGASPFSNTHLAAAALSLYLLLEAQLYFRRSDTFGLISPVLLALVLHFFLSYLLGITVSAFEPWVLERHAYLLPNLDEELANTMLLAILAAFCMLRGYGVARPLARGVRRSFEHMRGLRREIRSDLKLLVGMQIFYLFLVAYAINLGAYGMLSTFETRARHADIQQFLNLALAAGTLSYFLILLRYFERRLQRRANSLESALVMFMISMHVFFGALAAFKGQIVFPFVIAGFAYFLVTRHMPKRFFALAIISLILAYAVIEPYRSYLGALQQPPSSVAEAARALNTAISMRSEFTHDSDVSRAEAIASRFDLAGMTALAVDYVDNDRLQASNRQEFQDSILLAPILAFVPRAIWQSKPSYSPGVWFNQEVRGRWENESTSVGMGPIGYLYMTGGVVAVVLGFLGFGMLQSLIFEGIGRAGAGGLIIFLSVAGTLIGIPTSFGPAVTGVLRMLPVAFVTQWLLLRR
jgi:hypothetical protein